MDVGAVDLLSLGQEAKAMKLVPADLGVSALSVSLELLCSPIV